MRKHTSVALRVLLAAVMICAALFTCSCKKDQTQAPSWESDPAASAFVGEIGGCSETYVGAVSEKKYQSGDEAAKEYVKNEIVSAEKNCEVTEVTAPTELSKKELKTAGIPEEYTKDATKVEKYTVTYQESDKAEAANGENTFLATGTKKTVTVYVIVYADYYKYFTPVTPNGDTVTKTYYDSIFNEEKYKNCTMEQVMEIKMDGISFGDPVEVTARITVTAKYADGKILLISKEESTDTEVYPNSEYELYFETTADGNNICKVRIGGGSWMEANLQMVGVSSVNDLTPFHDQYLDHTYFRKTDYGCALDRENMNAYLQQALSDLISSLGEDIKQTMNGFVNYYVSGGVLSGVRSEINLNFSNEDASVKATITSTIKCTGYGTTTVTDPTK